MIFGNGGSAAIASHVAVDLTKNAKVRAVNFNEADLITCFSNDYGYENIFSRQLEGVGADGDILIAISRCLSACSRSSSLIAMAYQTWKL